MVHERISLYHCLDDKLIVRFWFLTVWQVQRGVFIYISLFKGYGNLCPGYPALGHTDNFVLDDLHEMASVSKLNV